MTVAIMDDFLIRALIAGCMLALVAGVLGVFVVWRRMAYFGDAIAHSSLLGVALGIVAGVQPGVAVILVAVSIALLLQLMISRLSLSSDTLLGIFSHTGLAIGLVVLSQLNGVRIDPHGLLFGDILSVGIDDLDLVVITGIIVLIITAIFWNSLLPIVVHRDLAWIEGVPVFWIEVILMVNIALVISMAMKVVGVLLITALLIVPAAAARSLSSSPLQMTALSVVVGILSVLGGLAASWYWDTPTGPSIVVCAATVFVIFNLIALIRRQLNI